uniref:Endonuclease n=1 Tax=Cacopsylla melanoneura TaxID=428564 RepID=A0A8D8RLV6_9HEMI
MESLKKKRSYIKGRVTKLENKVNASDLDKELAKTFLKSANSLEDDLISVENSILELCEEEQEVEEFENYYDEVLLTIQHLTAKINKIINSPDNSMHSVVQLPTIKLPTFNGQVDQWSSFKDMFEGLVHNNNALSSIQKFQYLKTSLVQDAAELIQHLHLRADNYVIAWNLLCENFSNRYSTVNHHLKNIVEVEYSSSKRMYSFKNILNTLRTNLNALQSLGVNTENWDVLLIHLIEAKFDDQVYLEWVKRVDKKHLPTLSNLYGFLDEMTLISERSESRVLDRKKGDVPTSSTLTCQVCRKANHKLYECSSFRAYSIKERIAFVTKNNLCLNCLSSNLHSAYKCNSKSVCKICSKKHHSLLHQFASQANYAADEQEETDLSVIVDGDHFDCDGDLQQETCVEVSTTACTQFEGNMKQQVLLSTAVVSVEDSNGVDKPVRVLLDSGSQSNFVTTECVKRLNLKIKKVEPINVNGIGGSNRFSIDSICNLTMKSRFEKFVIPMTAIVVPKVTNKLPALSFGKSNWDYLANYKLSDPQFNVSQHIDMIVGAEYFYDILRAESIQGPDGYPNLHNSKFGWIVTGKVPNTTVSNFSSFHVNLDTSLKRFWELEELPAVKHLSQEEKDCEMHFAQNVSREPDGRYMIKLPFKSNVQELGESKARAVARLRTIEKGLNQCESNKQQYFDFMKEYSDLGHMSKVSNTIDWSENLPHFYLPHHSVIRESSTTTRLRVVFDGSAKSTNGNSMNNLLMVGPGLQESIFSLLIRFRKYKVVLKADCEKMYRSIWIHPEHEIFGEFASGWRKFHSQLHFLNDIKIVRNVAPFSTNEVHTLELHGFSDASESAYAACVYVRILSHDKEVACNLLCAKSRVTPLKQVSLPRLELCAAVLLAKLLSQVQESWRGKIDSCHAWTDSMIVLDWLRQEPRKWKTFVANRVSQIHELYDPNIWYHVSSDENPADVASRGISGDLLSKHSMWWHGPHWLKSEDISEMTKKGKCQFSECENIEKRKIKTVSLLTQDTYSKIELWNTMSSFTKMVRLVAWCLRFANNASRGRVNGNIMKSKYLEAAEIRNAKLKLVKMVQGEAFQEDLLHIKKHGCVKNKSAIKSLNPFIDSDGILKVGGRLRNSDLSDEAKHQILLPNNHNFTKRLVEFLHEKYVHAGPNLLLAHIRQEYWVIKGLNLAKKVFHGCLSCFRANPSRMIPTQMMGDLPAKRVKPNFPFSTCGVDYAGPFMVKRMGGRYNVLFKAYVALFVCFSTKAFHIEVVSDLTTNAFLDALRRFVSRRGKPSDIYSDNGTNFVGCDNMLRKFIKELQNDEEFCVYFANEEITWHFNPANSPHMGGLWECGVKTVKSNLKRVIGDQSLSFEQLSTTLALIEATLNSRPLTPVSNDANDLDVLTPGHFLIGRPLTAVPEPNVPMIANNRLQRWALSRKIQQDFWKRWSLEYLNTLTQRFKWQFSEDNIKPGVVVLVRDDNLPPGNDDSW